MSCLTPLPVVYSKPSRVCALESLCSGHKRFGYLPLSDYDTNAISHLDCCALKEMNSFDHILLNMRSHKKETSETRLGSRMTLVSSFGVPSGCFHVIWFASTASVFIKHPWKPIVKLVRCRRDPLNCLDGSNLARIERLGDLAPQLGKSELEQGREIHPIVVRLSSVQLFRTRQQIWQCKDVRDELETIYGKYGPYLPLADPVDDKPRDPQQRTQAHTIFLPRAGLSPFHFQRSTFVPSKSLPRRNQGPQLAVIDTQTHRGERSER